MGRAPCCEKVGLRRGRWTAEEDEILINYIKKNGDGSWRSLPKRAGLLRCGKSCRLRWINYLRADLKRGNFTREEEETIIKLRRSVGNKWSLIASNLPGRTDNEIKNYWNSHLSRKIYSFRSCNGSMVTTMDMIKMANTCKRRGGRVSRAVAKKYNMNAISKATAATSSRSKQKIGPTSGIQEAMAAEDAEVGSAEESGRNDLKTLDKVEREGINGIDGVHCNGLQRCPGTLVESLQKMEGEDEVLGPNEELNDVTLLLEQIMQDGLMDLSEISVGSEETGKKSMDPESASVNNESDNGANSHSDTGDLYECFSPLNSYYSHHDLLTWDEEYAVQEFQLWDEGDDLLWP